MINIKFIGHKFKIYADGRIVCLDEKSPPVINMLKDIINEIDLTYAGPSAGFPVSRMARLLPQYGVEVISYRDYEMENADPGTVY